MKNTLKKVLSRTAAYYTVSAGLYSFIIFAMYSSAEGGALLDAKRVLLLLPFCFFFAIANTFLTSQKMPAGIGAILHCITTLSGVYLCVILPADMEQKNRLIGFVSAAVVYAVAMVIYFLIAAHIKKTLTEDANYNSQFNKNSEE